MKEGLRFQQQNADCIDPIIIQDMEPDIGTQKQLVALLHILIKACWQERG